METTNTPYKILYHIFADHRDEWTEDYDEAKAYYDQYVANYGNARLYKEIYETEEDYDAGDAQDEDCLEAAGAFPC